MKKEVRYSLPTSDSLGLKFYEQLPDQNLELKWQIPQPDKAAQQLLHSNPHEYYKRLAEEYRCKFLKLERDSVQAQ